MTIFELKQRQVINTKDCRFLGYVCDVDIDIECGAVIAIIVPGPSKCFGLVNGEIEYYIRWEKIKKIGPDVILVDVCIEEITRKCIM